MDSTDSTDLVKALDSISENCHLCQCLEILTDKYSLAERIPRRLSELHIFLLLSSLLLLRRPIDDDAYYFVVLWKQLKLICYVTVLLMSTATAINFTSHTRRGVTPTTRAPVTAFVLLSSR